MNPQIFPVLRSLSQSRFSGCLIINKSANDSYSGFQSKPWHLFFYLGRLIGDAGGIHPIRRWLRCLYHQGQQLTQVVENILKDSDQQTTRSDFLIQKLLTTVVLPHSDIQNFIEQSLLEVLFDIYQSEIWLSPRNDQSLTYQIKAGHLGDQLFPAIMLNIESLLAKLKADWRQWQQGKLMHYSPHLAPYVRDQQGLQRIMSPDNYIEMVQLLDGQHTFRDLAKKLNQDLTTLTRSLIHGSEDPSIGLGEIEDYDFSHHKAATQQKPQFCHVPGNSNIPVIGYISQDEPDLKLMKKIAIAEGYGYLGIMDPTQALKTFGQYRPQIIFMDMVLTNHDAYHLYSSLRRTKLLQSTPIIVVGGNNSLWHAMRGKLVRITASIKKPIYAQGIRTLLQEHTTYQYDSNLDQLARQLIAN